jgi:phosphoglycolate phosphatase-like HAD superfamily hydrolase
MVNFHGSVIPRGWGRTWPQVIGYEAIRGSEYYVFYDDMPLTAEHNVIQPFTRNVVGAMDYTPVALTAPGRTTSDAHELAMAVAFECGITHFADDVDVYASRPEVARALSELPPVWEETMLLAGTPDTEAIIARRHGDRWFVGALSTGPARALDVPLDRLGGGRWRAWVVTDSVDGGLMTIEQDVEQSARISVAVDGGFFAILARPDTELFRATPRRLTASPIVDPARTLLVGGRAEVRTGRDARLRVPPGWTAEARAPDRWEVRAPVSLPPGQLGVVTVEEAGDDGVPRVAHARLIAPLTRGEHVLSRLPMLAFTNESGPVERDMSNGGGNPADGLPMRIAAEAYGDGFGVSTPSSLSLPAELARGELTVDVGVDDETPGARAVAEVVADGAVIARADVQSGRPATSLRVSLANLRTLELRTRPVDADDPPAHVDWAHGRLIVDASDPAHKSLRRSPTTGH